MRKLEEAGRYGEHLTMSILAEKKSRQTGHETSTRRYFTGIPASDPYRKRLAVFHEQRF